MHSMKYWAQSTESHEAMHHLAEVISSIEGVDVKILLKKGFLA